MSRSYYLGGPIAQMNWGRLLRDPGHPDLQPFEAATAEIYRQAEAFDGFVWRIPDEEISRQIPASGFDARMSATVSVWRNYQALRDYTFDSDHGRYLARSREWFETVEGPQLVIWNADMADRPSFTEALDRLKHLRESGPSQYAFGWIEQL